MRAPLRITHVMPRLGLSGPVRSLVAAVKYAERLGLAQSHRVVALEEQASPLARLLLRREGVAVELAPDDAALDAALTEAHVVLLHFWSSPSTYEFLLRPLPTMRLAVWVVVHGVSAPQMLPHRLVDVADLLIFATPYTFEAPALRDQAPAREPVVVPGIIDVTRLEGFEPVPHDGVVVGYLGTVNRAKMHPRFVALCAAVDAPDVSFVVYGSGGEEQLLREQAAASDLSDRFEVRGFAENLATALGTMDVFGYPLCNTTYASSEMALQEAMWAGIPPVVFPHGGVRHLVKHGRTGLVATDDAEYVRHVETLVRDPELRQRLGHEARDEARRAFDPETSTRALDAALRKCVELEPRLRVWSDWGSTPAEWFAHSLGDAGAPFLRSLAAGPGADPEAEAAIAATPSAVTAAEGGLIQWRNHSPSDPWLRYWSALIFEHRCHPAADTERAAVHKLLRGRASGHAGSD